LGLLFLNILETRFKLAQDLGLSVCLSISLSLGAFFASIFQQYLPVVYKQSLIFLYGQAATLMKVHVLYFSIISVISILFLAAYNRLIGWICFDASYLRLKRFNPFYLEFFLYFLLSCSVVIGSRACGIMLVSGLMIAPAIFSRAFTHNLAKMMWISSIIGGICGFFGLYLSVILPQKIPVIPSLPSGPIILLLLAFCTLLALVFSFESGLLIRFGRKIRFSFKIFIENSLKELFKGRTIHPFAMFLLRIQGLAINGKLTKKGNARAQNLIRLHRLWELYLAVELKVEGERIHESAEEMEHILNNEMEARLTQILKNPLYDPHSNRIPEKLEEHD
jgi:manganese/zinc/iron transport system permease protein